MKNPVRVVKNDLSLVIVPWNICGLKGHKADS